MATNKNITMKQFNGVNYDTLYPKTIASQIDDVYSKDEMSNLFLLKAGGSMVGKLKLTGTPAEDNEAVTKAYVDAILPAFTEADNGKVLGVVNGALAWVTK